MSAVFFDNSLSSFAAALVPTLGKEALTNGVFLRDGTGRLCFVHAKSSSTISERGQLEATIKAAIGAYGRDDDLVICSDEIGAQSVLESADILSVKLGDDFCRLVDRRIVGSSWLRSPRDQSAVPPRIVFASLKGGVGRSTALAVSASHLAEKGLNVLVVDLDIEAPGLGEIILSADNTPEFGSIDYLVENGISGIADSDLHRFLGSSNLTYSAGGRVDVLPAIGTTAKQNPQNVLPKLARAMIEDVSNSDGLIDIGTQVSKMILRFTELQTYDAVLIDARAGLAEMAAPVVLQLDATVLFFGTAQVQTIAGYRGLFAGLNQLAVRDRTNGLSAKWRSRYRPVLAKVSQESNAAWYQDEVHGLYADYLYDEEEEADSGFNFSINDPQAPHKLLAIAFDQSFLSFEPRNQQNHLLRPFYERAFAPFLSDIDKILLDTSQKPLEKLA